MKATAPIWNVVISSTVKSSIVLQRLISADRITRAYDRNSQFKAVASRCIKYRKRLRTESTHGLYAKTLLRNHAHNRHSKRLQSNAQTPLIPSTCERLAPQIAAACDDRPALQTDRCGLTLTKC
jgi:hypothetical protein